MNKLRVLCLLIELGSLYAAPASENSSVDFYSALINKCPLGANEKFKSQSVFNKCKNWDKISQTKALSEENQQDVRCLLFFDSFVSFCTELQLANKPFNPEQLVPALSDYNVISICQNHSLFPGNRKFEYNVSKIINQTILCYKLCTNYDGTPDTECSLAHYFANFNITQLESTTALNATRLVHQVAAVAPAQATVNVPQNTEQKQTKQEVVSGIIPQEQQSVPEINVAQNEQQQVLVVSEINSEKNKTRGETVQGDHVESAKILPINPPQGKAAAVGPPPPIPQLHDLEKSQSAGAAQGPPDKSKNLEEKPNEAETSAKQSQALENIDAAAANRSPGKQEAQTNAAKDNKNSLEPPPDKPAVEKPKDDTEEKEEEDAEQKNLPYVPAEEEMDQNDDGDDDDDNMASPVKADPAEEKKEKPSTLVQETPAFNNSEELTGESYFFSYFMVVCVLFVLGYVGYHNRLKVMALVLEGKRGKRQHRSRRPNSANYHKLDSNLEEAISSTCTKNASHVIY